MQVNPSAVAIAGAVRFDFLTFHLMLQLQVMISRAVFKQQSSLKNELPLGMEVAFKSLVFSVFSRQRCCHVHGLSRGNRIWGL